MSNVATSTALSLGLTPREVQIAKMIIPGMLNKQIALALGISEQTVKNHVTSILKNLGVQTRAGIALKLIQLGFTPHFQPDKPVEVHHQLPTLVCPCCHTALDFNLVPRRQPVTIVENETMLLEGGQASA